MTAPRNKCLCNIWMFPKERVILLAEEQKEYLDPGLSITPKQTVPPPLPHLPIYPVQSK